VVGEQTDGGAHAGAYYRLHPHFEAFIPVGRAINPVTGGNWERSGVTPDVPVPAEQALAAAYRLALESVIERLGAADSGPIGVLLEEAREALDKLDGAPQKPQN
jgi:C-terminal processing protease CtpA/Prc